MSDYKVSPLNMISRSMSRAFWIIFTLIISLSLLVSPTVFAKEEVCDEGRLRDLTIAIISCKEEACSLGSDPTPVVGGGLKAGDSVYILGDSITAGVSSTYKAKFAEKQITATVNAFIGRSWTTGGGFFGTPGKTAVQNDTEAIKASKGIIIALGSNGGSTMNPVDQAIDAVRAINPSAPIWWVNTAATSEYPKNLSFLGPFNKTLIDLSSTKNFRIIDWAKTVNPSGDVTVMPTSDPGKLLRDGLHPGTDGGNKLIDLVVNNVAGGSSVPSTGSTTIPTAPSGQNPYLTVEYPSALNGFSDAAISGAINKYISDRKPQSVFANLGGNFASGGKASNINPFLAVAHLEIESGFGTASSGWHTIAGSNNAFGRTATASQPHVTSSSGRLVYQWSSWADSLSGQDSWFSYIKRKVDQGAYSKDLTQYINQYAPPGENNTQQYIENTTKIINALASLAGDPNVASYATSSSGSGSGCTCDIPTSTNLTGADNQEKAFRFFLSKGLTAEQAAGAVGNMMLESGLDPELLRGGKTRTKDPSTVEVTWGIIQWLPGKKVLNIAKEAGITTPIYELGTQLELVWWHMGNTSPTGAKNMLAEYRQISNVKDATEFFEKKIEGSGGQALSKRVKFAEEALTSYGGIAPSASSGATPTGSSDRCAGGNGSNTQFAGDFVVYNQGDARWAQHPYGSSTVKVSGCGPSAMAMIVTALTGQQITPDKVADVAAAKGMYVAGSGSSHAIGKVIAEHYGLKSEPLTKDLGAITAALQAGKLVVAPGQGAKPFTGGGHFIVIRGITPDGKFKVGDSGHRDTSDKDWDPQPILRDMRSTGIYAISK